MPTNLLRYSLPIMKTLLSNDTTHASKGSTALLGDERVIQSGMGACKSCDCRGYERGARDNICTCGHHVKQHR
jgi:hypothetical protein